MLAGMVLLVLVSGVKNMKLSHGANNSRLGSL